jgi:hypothetical protein
MKLVIAAGAALLLLLMVWAVYRLVFRELMPDEYEAGVPKPSWVDRQVPILMFGVLMLILLVVLWL